MMVSVAEKIQDLKRKRHAVILAHNYTSPDIQDLADYVGDSLGLSIEAANTAADVIVFCGVSFMGETAKILNPDKKVLLPEPDAHCAMAAMCTGEQIRDFRSSHPEYCVIGYVNSTLDAKKEMDICCTSSNVIDVVKSVKGKNILLVPDMNLGAYAASETGIDIDLWNGFCPIHHGITVQQTKEMRSKYPDAIIAAHPECRKEVLELADHIGSTESMVSFFKASENTDFIVLTEIGMKHRLEKECPGKNFYFPEHAVCTTMKMVTPYSVLDSLENDVGEIFIEEDALRSARKAVKRMIDL